jgi:hypothetical protein
VTYNSPDNPLFATPDPNREFIKNAVRYLLDRQYKDREASAILQEHFLKSEALTDETLPDTLESELTFRDQAVGEKLESLKVVAEMFRFLSTDIYYYFTNREAPNANAKAVVKHINAARQAIRVLYAPYVDEQYMRDLGAALDQEAIDDGIEPITELDIEHPLH